MFAHRPQPQAVHVEVDDRRGVESEHLADDKATYDGNPKGPPQFRAEAATEGQGDRPLPRSKARGPPPNSAAMVVNITGRKRSRQASKIASFGLLPCTRSATRAKW